MEVSDSKNRALKGADFKGIVLTLCQKIALAPIIVTE